MRPQHLLAAGLLTLLLVPAAGAVEAVGLEWTETIIDTGITGAFINPDSDLETPAVVYAAGTDVKFAIYNATSGAFDKTTISSSGTIGLVRLAHVVADTWVVYWTNTTGNRNMFAKTTNDGANWTVTTIAAGVPTAASDRLWILSNDDYQVLAQAGAGSTAQYITQDGGATWNSVTCNSGVAAELTMWGGDAAMQQFDILGSGTAGASADYTIYRFTANQCGSFTDFDPGAGSQTYVRSSDPQWSGARNSCQAYNGALFSTNPSGSTGDDDGVFYWSSSTWDDFTSTPLADGPGGILIPEDNGNNDYRCWGTATRLMIAGTNDDAAPYLWYDSGNRVQTYGVTTNLTTQGTFPTLADNTLWLFYRNTSNNTLRVWVSATLPTPEAPVTFFGDNGPLYAGDKEAFAQSAGLSVAGLDLAYAILLILIFTTVGGVAMGAIGSITGAASGVAATLALGWLPIWAGVLAVVLAVLGSLVFRRVA